MTITAMDKPNRHGLVVHNARPSDLRNVSSASNTTELFDDRYRPEERLPRIFEAVFRDNGGTLIVSIDGTVFGDPLTDKSYIPDGYRFHDSFHICNAAVLGWSPVLRSILRRRRRSAPLVDGVEDGGRAQMIEEAICHVVHDYGRDHDLSIPQHIDRDFVLYVRRLSSGLEVQVRDLDAWLLAISSGHRMFACLCKSSGGRIKANLRQRSVHFSST
jgi:hypothetical protein